MGSGGTGNDQMTRDEESQRGTRTKQESSAATVKASEPHKEGLTNLPLSLNQIHFDNQEIMVSDPQNILE